ncbi:DoxX family protein [Candidatus Peregrinibacteria bacterium]|nr:DoxX family protein [Candidatus Peregrinibacteria bacterium]MBI3816959.1 DoxX family protein [Candidatus Peregrinibacteria bacterium]
MVLSFLLGYSSWGLLILRLTIGAVFLYHCQPKLKGAMGGGFMMFIGWAELLGGLAMVLGFLTQLAAVGLGIIMVGALYKKTQEWHIPFAAQDKTGWEFDLVLFGGCAALLLLGGGSISLEGMFGF